MKSSSDARVRTEPDPLLKSEQAVYCLTVFFVSPASACPLVSVLSERRQIGPEETGESEPAAQFCQTHTFDHLKPLHKQIHVF